MQSYGMIGCIANAGVWLAALAMVQNYLHQFTDLNICEFDNHLANLLFPLIVI